MALSQTLPETDTSTEATASVPVATDENAVSETPSTTTITRPDDVALKLDGLYDSASRLEVELEGVVRRNTASLTPGQMGGFNAILKMAIELLPHSVALREDVGEVDETTRPTDAHQALHVTIVPTLHNALPEPLYSSHG